MSFIVHPKTAAEVVANGVEAEALRLPCPKCGQVGHAVARHRQATRQEPCRFTGVDVHCPCDPSFLEGRPMVASYDADEIPHGAQTALSLTGAEPNNEKD